MGEILEKKQERVLKLLAVSLRVCNLANILRTDRFSTRNPLLERLQTAQDCVVQDQNVIGL